MDENRKLTYRHLLNFWPLVPALDLQNVFEPNLKYNIEEPFFTYQAPFRNIDDNLANGYTRNCLIVGDGIGCLVKSISRMFRHDCNNLTIYKVSSFLESLTRDFLLLHLFEEKSLELSLMERAETFLEILGNVQIRNGTKHYIDTRSDEILQKLECLTDDASILPFLSLDHLKQREIDEIVNILTYLKDDSKTFSIVKGWNNALRSYYGTRYDNRKNLFDYHFNMKLDDYKMISLKKYMEWCDTGMAFKFRQSRYNFINKTLRIASIDADGDMYVGDLATSPYIVFGAETGNVSLLQKANGSFLSNSEDISKFNIIDMMNEFSSLTKKEVSKKVMIHPMLFESFSKRYKFKEFFDVIYVTCDMMPVVESFLSGVLKENGVVVFETMKNVVNSTKQQKAMFCEAIDNLALASGLKPFEKECFKDNENFKMFILKKVENTNTGVECQTTKNCDSCN